MNERIRELDAQAVEYAVGVCDANGLCHYQEYLQVVKEKFAELIVRECCFVGEQYADGLFDSKHYAFVNKKIKEHFGVEE